ncbi:DUF3772 domain-containing protein [Roseobacter sinensis]|uniref:DUF3772 domain-containing protein n=1 Tax=Roseobacter sinensis TaxID=2931391 RepID=A0ABT3BEM0_9RHOB|nr:DUF3772 domain-containing protein [Roseobacter sp. WL0113]MCV3272010.1 DUF3772 domain-containing protein [Roseobacter sp. WL0113]
MRRVLTALLTVVLALWVGVAAAQHTAPEGLDYDAWEQLAELSETAIDNQESSSEQFEALRSSIADFRARFSSARSVNAERIATLRAQIEALGPAPEDGSEPAELAARRAELETQLQTLQAPVQVADEAFRRADGLIREIDIIIRERQAERLLSLGPSPLNPVHWPIALREFGTILSRLGEESQSWADPENRRQLRENAPLTLLLFAVGLLLIIRGRAWAGFALSHLRRWGGPGSGVWRFLVSLFRIIIPLIGLVIFVEALRSTGLAGERTNQILDGLPIWGGVLLGFRWLAERLFARDQDDALIHLTDAKRSQARFYTLLLSVLFVMRGAAEMILQFDGAAPETRAVVAFPIVLLTGLVLATIGQLLRGLGTEAAEGEDENARGAGLVRVLRFAGIAMIFVSIAAPAMAAIGYEAAGDALLYPTLVSALLLGLVLVLQRFSADVYCLVTGQGPQGRDALIPVLMGFVLLIAASPLLALAWGARVADLTELWATFSRGFAIGETRISPGDFLTFAIIFVAGYTLTRLIQGALRSNVLPKTRIDIGGQNAIVSGVGYVGIFLAALLAITGAGINLSSLAIVAGALSVGIGFGLQNIVQNFVSGIILLIERPISEGDWIEVGGQMGYVRDISVRSTRIETFDRTDVIVPNADLVSGTVTNFTRGNKVGRLIVQIGVAYGTDTRKVDRILREIAEDQPMVLRNPAPLILFNNFGADSLEFEIRAILRDVNWIMAVKNDINHAIAERFAEEGIEVPFAQRDIWLRNPEVLHPGPSEPSPKDSEG